MTSTQYPSPEPDAYPGFTAREVAAARLAVAAAKLAAAAVKLALYEHGLETMSNAPAAPIAKVLSYYATLLENGCTPEQAQVEVILYSYFDADGKAIAHQMGGDFSDHPDRFVALALMEFLNTRMTPETETALAEVDPPGPGHCLLGAGRRISTAEAGAAEPPLS